MGLVKSAALVLAGFVIAASPALAAQPDPPVNQSPPVLGPNNAPVGATVTVTPGTWSGEDATSTTTYQWYRYVGQVPKAISGATGQSYTVTTADESGLVVSVTVTADSGAVAGDAFSNAISITAPYPPINASQPVLSGTPVRGSTLHVSTGRWSQYPSPIAGSLSYSYQWLRCRTQCNVSIPGATHASYAIQLADWGRGLEVKVTATDLIGSTYAYSNGLGVTPPTETEDNPPFPRIAGDPLLISAPAGGFCFGLTCTEESVSALLQKNGFTRLLTVKQRGTLSVRWVATRGAKSVTLGSERAVFRSPGKYRTRFALSRSGRALLRSSPTLSFLVVGLFSYPPGSGIGCDYSAMLNAARQIVINPACEV